MCATPTRQCYCGASGYSKPRPSRVGLPGARTSRPASRNTRNTLDGLTATTSASIIINLRDRDFLDQVTA